MRGKWKYSKTRWKYNLYGNEVLELNQYERLHITLSTSILMISMQTVKESHKHILHVKNDWMNDGVVLSLWETHHHHHQHQHISIKKNNFFILLYFLLTSSFLFFYQEYLMKFSAKVERDVRGSKREKRMWAKEKWKCALAICAQNKSIVTPYRFMKFRFLFPPSHPHFLDIEWGHFLHIFSTTVIFFFSA